MSEIPQIGNAAVNRLAEAYRGIQNKPEAYSIPAAVNPGLKVEMLNGPSKTLDSVKALRNLDQGSIPIINAPSKLSQDIRAQNQADYQAAQQTGI
jgi:hypothetical protein